MPVKKSAVNVLVIANIIVFILAYLAPEFFGRYFALYFPENPNFGIWQLVTNLFMHAGLTHLLFNMYGVWAFGSPLENLWGIKRFVTFYFVAGIGAAVIYTLVHYYQFYQIVDELTAAGLTREGIERILASGQVDTRLFNQVSEARFQELFNIYYTPAVGASGAVYGILAAFALTFPNTKLALIFLPIPIKAIYFVPLLVFADLFFGLTKYSVGNVAHFAHVGGALCGLLIMLYWANQSKSGQS